MDIYFEVSSLEPAVNDLVSHYEVKFTKPINASWLVMVLREALDEERRFSDQDAADLLDWYKKEDQED
jgi:hypothetical protein